MKHCCKNFVLNTKNTKSRCNGVRATMFVQWLSLPSFAACFDRSCFIQSLHRSSHHGTFEKNRSIFRSYDFGLYCTQNRILDYWQSFCPHLCPYHAVAAYYRCYSHLFIPKPKNVALMPRYDCATIALRLRYDCATIALTPHSSKYQTNFTTHFAVLRSGFLGLISGLRWCFKSSCIPSKNRVFL